MSYQLEVIRYRDLLLVTAATRFVPGVTPLTLEIKGEDFTNVERVLINEIACPEFMIVDKKTVYAQLPENTSSISQIEVVSSAFTRREGSSKISFEIGNKTRKVNGILKLVQLFAKWVLQSPGSDIFDPSRGGGLQEIVGKVMTGKNMQSIYATLTRSISTTASQIRTAQSNQSGLALDERLMGAELLDLQIFEDQMEARARVRLSSMTGAEALAALQL